MAERGNGCEWGDGYERGEGCEWGRCVSVLRGMRGEYEWGRWV